MRFNLEDIVIGVFKAIGMGILVAIVLVIVVVSYVFDYDLVMNTPDGYARVSR